MTDVTGTVNGSWEPPHVEPVEYQVRVSDHGQVYEFAFAALDLQYALATVLIEQHIYLQSADGIEIKIAEAESDG